MVEQRVLEGVGRRVRINHAIEHATITLLSRRITDVTMRGRSNRKGFYLVGDVSTQAVREAAQEAIDRLQEGEHELALHPFCGANLAVSGLLAGMASAVAMKSARKGETVPASILAALLALAVAQPLGFWTQRNITTDGHVGGVRVETVTKKRLLGQTLHFVRIQ